MKTIKDFTTDFLCYGKITVPAGTETTNETAIGIDKNYNFVNSFGWVKTNYPDIEKPLIHDLTYHGLNIPIEYLSVSEEKQMIKENYENILIEKSQKLTELLKEFKENKIFENCDYCVNPSPDGNGSYFLINIKTGKMVADGTPKRIKSYLNLRKIDPNKVYKYSYIDHKFITVY
jgi:hypothetical protein